MADNYIEKKMEDMRRGLRPETEEQIRRRVMLRREAERLAATNRKSNEHSHNEK